MPLSAQKIISPTLTDVLRAASKDALRDVRTVSWGTVQSFDTATSRATIQLVPRVSKYNEDGSRTAERVAILQNVPVLFVGIAGSVQITFNMPAGSVVLVLFMDSATDQWLTSGASADDSDPQNDRRFSVNDAVCLPVMVGGGGDVTQSSVLIDGPRIDIGSDSLNPVQDGVLTGQTIDPFLGVPYYTLGGASTKVLAKK